MKKKAKKYIFGKRFDVPGNTNDEYFFTFNAPAIASVLDGFNTVLFPDTEVEMLNNSALITIYVNNEILVNEAELRGTSIFNNVTSAPPAGTLFYGSNDREPYHPTPRPLSGSDEIRVRISNALSLGALWKMYIHFHYQPKQ